MKDEHDNPTVELAQVAQAGAAVHPVGGTARPQARPLIRDLVVDEQTEFKEPPECAERKAAFRYGSYGNFVPVSFVARDWNVSTRRIRALLAAQRLVGQLQPNGYWEVRYPYIFTMGTRGPELKRTQKAEKHLKLVVDNSERRPE